MDGEEQINSMRDAFEKLKAEFDIGSKDIVAGFANMLGGAEALSREFGIGRQRMQELMGAITEATPAVDRLGGNLSDAVNIMGAIANETRRNVVAGEEQVSKLFAASKVLGTDVGSIVNSFQEIGFEFTQLGKQVDESVQYIQSIGGNLQKIMGDVLNNMSAMNRFNFQDGVVGFTKMAAQAAILKTDMRTTLELAERALDPDEAIKLSSAFQRLGVSVGDLTDPFMLMNKSLNDPAGLQDSIVRMTQQFTYFDEKANQFKINPQGMLMLREIGREAGVSSQELSKMALNAADFDRKVSQISPQIKFDKEEDRIFLSNIAKMGKDGKYEIKMGDDYVQLEKLSQQQIDELIKKQDEAPKTVEDLQRAQLDAFTAVRGDLRAIKDKVVLGVVSTPTVRETTEGARGIMTSLSGAFEKTTPEVKFFRDVSEQSMEAIRSLVTKMNQGGLLSGMELGNLEQEFGKLKELEGKVDDKMRTAIETFLQENAKNNTSIGRLFQNFVMKEYDESKLKATKEVQTQTTRTQNVSGEIMGEIQNTKSSIIGKIDNVNSKLDRMATAQPAANAAKTTTDIVREIQTTEVKQGQVTVSFDASNPIKIDLNLTSDGKLDMAKIEDTLLNSEKISEALAINMKKRFETMNYSPIVNMG